MGKRRWSPFWTTETSRGEVGTEIMAVVQLGLLELVSDGRSVVQAEPEAISAKMPVETKPATSPVPSDSTDDDPLLQRLKREYGTIETAPPPVVLGIPADSPRAMVDRAAERMRARYSEIESGQDVSEEVRHVATQTSASKRPTAPSISTLRWRRVGTSGRPS